MAIKKVLIRWLKKVPPFNVGEQCAVDENTAASKVKQKLAVYVDASLNVAPTIRSEESTSGKKRLKVKVPGGKSRGKRKASSKETE